MSPLESSSRYAVYFAPATHSELYKFGSSWLGRDAATGIDLKQPCPAGIAPERLREITRAARHYGFHATLKAPFRLNSACTEDQLCEAILAMTQTRTAFLAPPLELATIEGWRALVLSNSCAEMQALSDEVVAGLDHFRAPLTTEEIERRRSGNRLTPRECVLLQRWGYPYVFDRFQFHMTLAGRTGTLEGTQLDAALTQLVEQFRQIPTPIDAVALFHQPNRQVPFMQVCRFPFCGASDIAQT